MHPDPRAAAAHLIACAERELAAREVAAQTARFATVAAVAGFRNEAGPFRAWLIGTLAWGEFDEASDVDVVVDGLDAPGRLELEARVAKATGRAVDLLPLAGLGESFARRVADEGVAL